MIWIIALGMVLPTMHQSSLGTLMLLAGSRLHPLWRTPLLPLLFLITCVSMGYAVVVFESAFSSVGVHTHGRRRRCLPAWRRDRAAAAPGRGRVASQRPAGGAASLGLLVAGDVRSSDGVLELALFLAPAVMLLAPADAGMTSDTWSERGDGDDVRRRTLPV